MNNIAGVEGFVKAYMGWYQGFLDELSSYPWSNPSSPLFTQRNERGANITKQTPLGLPYAGLGTPLDKLVTVDKGLWEPLKQKESELADKVKYLREGYNVDGSPLVSVIGYMGTMDGEKFIALPQYDVFTGAIQLRVWEYTILNIRLGFERAPLSELKSLGESRVSIQFRSAPVITGKRFQTNNYWHIYRSGDYFIEIEGVPDGDSSFHREIGEGNKKTAERLFSFQYRPDTITRADGTRENVDCVAGNIWLSPKDLDGRLTGFLSMLRESQPDPAYLRSKLVRI